MIIMDTTYILQLLWCLSVIDTFLPFAFSYNLTVKFNHKFLLNKQNVQ